MTDQRLDVCVYSSESDNYEKSKSIKIKTNN